MKVFQEVTLLPNVDVSLYFLWEKVFQQIHLALVEMQDPTGRVSIGVAFPEYDGEIFQLGKKLRFFAHEESELVKLDVKKWISRLTDYVHVTGIRPVPAQAKKYAVYKRQQPKSSTERLARRKAKREGLPLTQALMTLKDYQEHHVKTPFIQIKSLSSQKRFRLFIFKEITENAKVGAFSSYGLSDSLATVPEF